MLLAKLAKTDGGEKGIDSDRYERDLHPYGVAHAGIRIQQDSILLSNPQWVLIPISTLLAKTDGGEKGIRTPDTLL